MKHVVTRVVLCMMGCLIFGCAAMLPKGPNVNTNDVLLLTENTYVSEVLGTSFQKTDHQSIFQDRMGPVLPRGTIVEVDETYKYRLQQTLPNSSLREHNPWIFVHVKKALLDEQGSWKGWIHFNATKPLTTEDEQPVVSMEHVLPFRMKRPALVCPYSNSGRFACTIQLPENTKVNIIDCELSKAKIEFWNVSGLYGVGYVDAHKIENGTC